MLSIHNQASEEEAIKKFTKEWLSFTGKCLLPKEEMRFRFKFVKEMKSHRWFKGFDWEALATRKMKPPFVPHKITKFEEKST